MGQSLFDVGRKLTLDEWGELKAWRAANPDLRWKRGDVREDGKVFAYYGPANRNGESWTTAEQLDRAREQKRQKGRAVYAADPAAKKAKNRQMYLSRRSERLEKKRAQYAAQPQAMLDASRRWRERNKEELAKRRRERVQTDPIRRTELRCRARIRNAFKRSGFAKNGKTQELVGCSWADLKIHLERQFSPGMTWDNQHAWHIDHIIPVSAASSEGELITLFHFSNLQPLWASDNLRKGDKLPHELLG